MQRFMLEKKVSGDWRLFQELSPPSFPFLFLSPLPSLLLPPSQKRHDRSSQFNLEEEEEEELTHYGRSLGEVGSFDDIQLSEEEMEEGELHLKSRLSCVS